MFAPFVVAYSSKKPGLGFVFTLEPCYLHNVYRSGGYETVDYDWMLLP